MFQLKEKIYNFYLDIMFLLIPIFSREFFFHLFTILALKDMLATLKIRD